MKWVIMTSEIPQNEARIVKYEVGKAGLQRLTEALCEDRNVIKWEVVRSISGFQVTIHCAIMDLPIQLSAAVTRIEKLLKSLPPE